MSQYLAPQIVFLKQGTDVSQGRQQLISNMNACMAVVDIVSTTLGPLGMDKLIYSDQKSVTISNDGATIVKLLDIVHPAAKTLADISLSQDAEVGDGTTSVMVIAGELLKNCKEFVEDGMHPRVIIKAYRLALEETVAKLKGLAINIQGKDEEEHRTLLVRCAGTALNSKLVSHYRDFFAQMVTDAVLALDSDLDIDLVGVKKVQGGSIHDSVLVKGVAFKKTFSYAGFEQQPKKFIEPTIMLLNIELELKSEKENAEVRVTSTQEYQEIVDAEWNIIYDKLDKIVATGAKVVLSKLAIGDLATQYFADRDIFCAGRVPTEDLERVQRAVGGKVLTTVNDLGEGVLGSCELFEEKAIGGERYNVFTGCPRASTATIIVRGGSEQFMAETERSLHDAIMIVRRAIKHQTAVGGAGAIEMELSKFLREHAMTIQGREQAILLAYAKSLEVIPRTLCDNAGYDSIDVLNKLRAKHAQGGTWYGVDIDTGGICDAWEKFIWEPALVKLNAISAATEAACLILSIDETVKNPASEQEQMQKSGQLPPGGGMPRMPGMGGRGRGRGMRMG